MNPGSPDDIGRLLAWPDDGSAIMPADGKLAAALAEALAGEAAPGQDDVAGAAAYLDGGLSQAERDAFTDRLAGSSAERAELAAATDLLDVVRRAPLAAPPHLAAQARARFAAAAVAAVPRPPERKRWSFALPAGGRLGWAVAAVAAVVVVGPLAMLQTRTPTPFAKAPSVAQPASADGGPGRDTLAIAPGPAVGPVALAPTPPEPAKIVPQLRVPKPEALALGREAGGVAIANHEAVVAVSERCATGSIPAPAPDPGAKPLSPQAQAERDACAAERARERRRSETVTASRREDITPAPGGLAADPMPAAAAASVPPPVAADPALFPGK